MFRKQVFGDFANDYISAYGHYGEKSPELVKHFAQDLGFHYVSADSKESFYAVIDEFLSPQISDRPLLLEVFMDDYDDVSAISLLQAKGIGSDDSAKNKTKKLVKNVIGQRGVNIIKKVIR